MKCIDKNIAAYYNVTKVTTLVMYMQWILFQYKVPNKPSKLRVYVWRKLKSIRAELLVEGLYALPLTEKALEQFEWLCAEVQDMSGTAVLWKSECISIKQEENLIARFQEKAGENYKKIQELLSQKPETNQDLWLDSIVKQYADTRYHDYFETHKKYTIHTQIERLYLKNKRRGTSRDTAHSICSSKPMSQKTRF